MASQRRKLQEDTRVQILRCLQENPDTTQRDLIKVAGISVEVTLYGLSALVDKGIAWFGNFAGAEGKRRYAYVLSPTGIVRKASPNRVFLTRKMEDIEALNEKIQSLQVNLDRRNAEAGA